MVYVRYVSPSVEDEVASPSRPSRICVSKNDSRSSSIARYAVSRAVNHFHCFFCLGGLHEISVEEIVSKGFEIVATWLQPRPYDADKAKE